MSMSKVKDTVNLVLMHQMKSVQWVEYYLWLNITIAENTWPWPLTYDLDLFAWPWPLCLTLRLIYCYIVLWRQKNKCLTSRDAKTVLRSLYRRQQSWSVFPQGTWCAQREVSTTSGSKVMAQKVIFLVLDMFDLDLDISRSFDFWEFAICSPAWLVSILKRYVH